MSCHAVILISNQRRLEQKINTNKPV